jgi:DNA-binding response OmpR family regulator
MMRPEFRCEDAARNFYTAIGKSRDAIAEKTEITTPGKPIGSVLTISSFEDDHVTLKQMLHGLTRMVPQAHTYLQALERVRAEDISVLICERNLPDGNWKDVLSAVAIKSAPPSLIVACRLADEHLWAEVLNLGGYDVLAKPFDAKEVLWTVNHACCRRMADMRNVYTRVP